MASENETLEDKKPEEVTEEHKTDESEDKKTSEAEEEPETKGEDENGEKEGVEQMEVDKEDEKEEEEEKEESEEEEKPAKKGKSEGSGKGEVKKEDTDEPVIPSSRPTRERKIVERYSEPSGPRSSTPKPLSIKKGSGTQLKDIPNVAYKLSKRKPDDNLQILHNILYGKKTKAHSLKKNIGQFSGFVWVENEEKQRGKVKERLDKCVKEKLLIFCDVLNIPVIKSAAKKEELSVKLLEFLESPHPTTDMLLADTDQKSKKQKRKGIAAKSPGSSDNTAGKSVKKHQKSEAGLKRKRSSKIEEEADDEPSDVKEDSEDDDEEAPKEGSDQEESGSEKDEQEEEEEKPKKHKSNEKVHSKSGKKDSGSKPAEKSKATDKGSVAKSTKSSSKSTKDTSSSASKKDAGAISTPKKDKVEKKSKKETESVKGNSSGKKPLSKSAAKDSAKEGKGKNVKKAKAEPSKEELHSVIANILKEVDFNTATLSDIIRQLGTHFDVDLMHRKAEVKAIITEVINNMSEEEEEDEAESGDDEEKHEGDDSDT